MVELSADPTHGLQEAERMEKTRRGTGCLAGRNGIHTR